MAEITMPQLGETVTEGTITRWAKQVGDSVSEDDVLFEVSTDKVDSEVPSPVAGVLTEILVPEGETVDVGTRLAVISGEDASSGASATSAPAAEPATDPEREPATSASEPATDLPDSEQDESADAEQPQPERADTPAPAPVAAAPVRQAQAAPSAPGAEQDRNAAAGLVLSPVVRRLISEHDLDPTAIRGTGPAGRITRSDVLAVIDQRNGGGAAKAPAAAPQPAPAPQPAGAPAAARTTSQGQLATAPPQSGVEVQAFAPSQPGERDTVVPFTNIRRRTAEHMVRSKHTSAHTMVAFEVDYSGVEAVRRAERDRFRESEGFGLTYLPFVTRAVVDAIEEFPHVNSSVGDDALIVHNEMNIGIAVDLDFEGLLVPVIHGADGKRMRVLAREISSLAAKARSKRVTMDDIAGGTFTITNAGPFGTLITVPVINQPQVAILSTDGVRKKPVVVEAADGTDAIAIHPMGNLVLSWDHRAFDGAYAAAFLRKIKEVIETRDWSGEL